MALLSIIGSHPQSVTEKSVKSGQHFLAATDQSVHYYYTLDQRASKLVHRFSTAGRSRRVGGRCQRFQGVVAGATGMTPGNTNA